MKRTFFCTALFCAFAAAAMAQGRGSGGLQGGRQSMPGMSRGQNQQSRMGQVGQQQRQQMRMRTTNQQREQYQSCNQSMQKVRNRVRQMSRLMNSQKLNAQQLRELNQQFRNEVRNMQQERERLSAGFDNVQSATAQDRLQQMTREQRDLEAFSDALGFELDQAKLDQDRIREHISNMDRTSKELQQQQTILGTELQFQ